MKILTLPRHFLEQVRTYSVGSIIRWRWLARSVSPLLQGSALHVLDAGCGDGSYAFRLARRYPAATFHGLDLMEKRLDRAKERLGLEPTPNLTFALGDITRSLGTACYDLVYSIDVFEHIPDDRAALAAIAEALKPGRRLFLHTPLSPQRHWLRRFDLDHCHRDDHVREGYTVADLEEKARAAGLEPIAAHYTHGRWGTLAWEIWMLTKERLWSRIVAWPAIRILIRLELARWPVWGNCVLFEAVKAPIS
jgi:SAM-dependent methyltransferase